MDFEHRCTIPVPRATLWQFLLDIPQMATCIPGVENVTMSDEDTYNGRMRVKLGPIQLTLQGTMSIEGRDQQQWQVVARSEATDRRVGGGVHVSTHLLLLENSPEGTELVVQTQARLFGKLAEFGQPVIRKQADTLLAEFARNLAARVPKATKTPPSEP
jgi:carbon monoxide dehydrogenase subunit G